MSTPSSSVERVRAAVAVLHAPGGTSHADLVDSMRALDTALRLTGKAGDDAADEFCDGPDGDGNVSGLRWCAGVLQRGVPQHGSVGGPHNNNGGRETAAATFACGVVLQVLISASGADHREQFGHVARHGAHEDWPKRGASVAKQTWTPDMAAPTGILPPLLALSRAGWVNPQVRLRALQLAGSVARDPKARPDMIRGGWRRVCARALEARPRPDFDDEEAKVFIYEREVWQYLDEALTEAASATAVADAALEVDRLDTAATATEKEASAREGAEARSIEWRRMPEAAERDVGEGDLLAEDTSWHGQMVRVVGLAGRSDLNGTLGFAQGVGSAEGRVAVLVNPLGSAKAKAGNRGSTFPGGGAPELVSIRRQNLTVVEVNRGQLHPGAPAEGAAAEVPLEHLRRRIATSGAAALRAEGEREVYDRMQEGTVHAAGGDYAAAAASFEAALDASTTVHDEKSLIRVHIMVNCWRVLERLCRVDAAAACVDAATSDPERTPTVQTVDPDVYARALRHASNAMDILEFRLDTVLHAECRSGRSNQPVSSLFELTAEEQSFLSVFVMTTGDEAFHFLGAPAAVTMAHGVFLPPLVAGRAPPGSAEAGDADAAAAFELACWRRIATTLRIIETAWRLGTLATVWRVDEAGGGDEGGVTRREEEEEEEEEERGGDERAKDPRARIGARGGRPVAVPLPQGSHDAFKSGRDAFLRAYFHLLLARFVPGETEEQRMASMVGVLQTNPLVLQFSMTFRHMLDAPAAAGAPSEEDSSRGQMV